MTETLVERYLRLALSLDRHVDGLVDAYYGPAELKAAVEAAPPVGARALLRSAEALLVELDDGWLRDQVAGLETCARALAGETVSYAAEVEGCYGVRPTYPDEAAFEAAHERLAELLPGRGSLSERKQHWHDASHVPPEKIEATLAAVIDEARRWTRDLVELPDGEGIILETTQDQSWWASCVYQGNLLSRIIVNIDLPLSAVDLLILALHETYPGHHTERCVKEQLLVRERGLIEETLVLTPTPQSLITEGIGKLAPFMLLEGEGGAALAELIRQAGIEVDLELDLAVAHALEPLHWVEVNAALMLHDGGASEAETQAYLERWGLETAQLAAHLIRFFKAPASRTYVTTYAAGRDLCRSYVAGDPQRFRQLVSEQIRVRDLLEAASSAPGCR